MSASPTRTRHYVVVFAWGMLTVVMVAMTLVLWASFTKNCFGLLALLFLLMTLSSARKARSQTDAGPTPPGERIVSLARAPIGVEVGIRARIAAIEGARGAPISRRRGCAAYELEVRLPVYHERGELIHREGRARRMTLRDQDVQARLSRKHRLEVELAFDRRGDTQREPNEHLEKIWRKAGFDEGDARSGDNHYLWSEGVLRRDDDVVVYGVLREVGDPTGGYRRGRRRLVVEGGASGHILICSPELSRADRTGANRAARAARAARADRADRGSA